MNVEFIFEEIIPRNESKLRNTCTTNALGRAIHHATLFSDSVFDGNGEKKNEYFFRATAGDEFSGNKVLPLIKCSYYEALCIIQGVWDIRQTVAHFYPYLHNPEKTGVARELDNIVTDWEGKCYKIFNINESKSDFENIIVLTIILHEIQSGKWLKLHKPILEYQSDIIWSTLSFRETAEFIFGEDLKLKSHYQKFVLPDRISTDNIFFLDVSDDQIAVYAVVGDTRSEPVLISHPDRLALKNNLASISQIAAKYLERELVAMRDYMEFSNFHS